MSRLSSLWPLAVLCALVGVGLFAGCGDEAVPTSSGDAGTSKPGDAAATDEDPATADGNPGSSDDPIDLLDEDDEHRFPSAAQCGKCHVEIYKEWKESYHGRAMSDPLFLEFSAEVNKEECIRCHAPEPLREVGFETPIARAERREDAVSCLTCHQVGQNVAGPSKGMTGACQPIHDPAQTDPVKMCFICHNQHDTGNEWMRGPYAPGAPEPRQRPEMNCIECHMPEVERPLVPGGPVRKGRRHTWFGGHSLYQLQKAAKLEAEVTPLDGGGFRFRAWVTNVGAGHNIPTDARHRSFDVYVKLTESDGTVLLDPLDFAQQAKSQVAKYRLQYRNSGLKDTQIPPLARVSGLGRWNGYIDVPAAKKGNGELWFVYRLTPRDVLDERSFKPKNPHDLGNTQVATVVDVLKFTYGE
ncbi:MAG: multiheme c-type cytochrome [Planctomycetota bacterium]|nr:multiheme c-type cytochrome [Planctomycetota bacterium]